MAGLHLAFALLLLHHFGTQSTVSTVTGPSSVICPVSCFCNAQLRIVYCNGRSFVVIPENIPSDTVQINLNENVFGKSTLQARNFSGLASLEYLYMSNCGIETIEPGAFSDLHRLQWLDLSNNRIRSVAPHTFNGLNMAHLFLSGNENIRLSVDSFNGLRTTGLYLHDCNITTLKAEVLQPLNGSLFRLWLNGNKLTTVDRQFKNLFETLQHLRLHSNPLHCNCELIWLKTFLDAHPDMIKDTRPPTCLTPAALQGRAFFYISSKEFEEIPCAPMFANDDPSFGIHYDNINGTSLKCIASGNPTPILYWIAPSGKKIEYRPPTESNEPTYGSTKLLPGNGSQLILRSHLGRNEAVLYIGGNNARVIEDGGIRTRNESTTRVVVDQEVGLFPARDELNVNSSELGVYVCLAVNHVGNASFSINVTRSISSVSGPAGVSVTTALVFFVYFLFS